MSDKLNPPTEPHPAASVAEYISRQAATETRLTLMEHRLQALDHSLNGNGRPGKLDVISARLDQINERMGKLTIAIAVLASATGGTAGFFVRSLMGGTGQ
jgi:hypothetical protein